MTGCQQHQVKIAVPGQPRRFQKAKSKFELKSECSYLLK